MPCMLRCVTMMMPVATDETFPFPSFSYAEVRLPAQYNALPRAVSRAGGRATRSSRRRRRGRVKSAIGVCAARTGHLDVLKYARENKCPWNRKICRTNAEKRGHDAVVEWIDSCRTTKRKRA